MKTEEVAQQLVSLCRAGKYEQVYKELYAAHAKSIEMEGTPYQNANGMEEIYAKGVKWQESVDEVLESFISDPIVSDGFFTCRMMMKVKMKGIATPVVMDELCVYRVEEGKIVAEQFFYTPEQETAEQPG